MSNVLEFPRVNGAKATGCSMPGLTTPELRARAISNYYTYERRKHTPSDVAWARAEAFGRDLERIATIFAEG